MTRQRTREGFSLSFVAQIKSSNDDDMALSSLSLSPFHTLCFFLLLERSRGDECGDEGDFWDEFTSSQDPKESHFDDSIPTGNNVSL